MSNDRKANIMRKVLSTAALTTVLSFGALPGAWAQHVSEGSWIWVKKSGGDAIQQKQSSFRVNADNRSGRYCYNSKCKNVALVTRGNVYTFSFSDTDYFEFEFESGAPNDMIGRVWVNAANSGAAPDAVVRMVSK
jgi:hypothetical protein